MVANFTHCVQILEENQLNFTHLQNGMGGIFENILINLVLCIVSYILVLFSLILAITRDVLREYINYYNYFTIVKLIIYRKYIVICNIPSILIYFFNLITDIKHIK